MNAAKHQKSLITIYTYHPAPVHRRRYTTAGVQGLALALVGLPSISPCRTLLLPINTGPLLLHRRQVLRPYKYKVGPLLPQIIEGPLQYVSGLRVELLPDCGIVARIPREHPLQN